MSESKSVFPIKVLVNAIKLDEGSTHHLAGNYHHVENLTIALARHPEIRIKVLCDEYTLKPLGERLPAELLEYTPLNNGGVWAADNAVVRAVNRFDPHVYHRPGGQLPLLRLKSPTVATFADLNFIYLKMPWTRRIYKQVSYGLTVRRASQITCVSHYTRSEVIRRLNADERKVTAIPHGTNCLPEPSFRLADEMGPLTWVTFGHQAHKNVETVLHALAQRPTDERLVVVGESETISKVLRPMAQQLGLHSRVAFPGRVPSSELHGLLKRSLGLVFLSLYEGFGLPLLEAMQAGCPVICSNVCSLPEVAGDAALVQNPRDAGAAAQAMHRLRGDAALRSQLVSRGFDRIKLFTWTSAAEQTVAVYQRAVDPTRCRNPKS
jgi:glycosyltransferase involved in cell wall biosynthesis